MDNVIADHTLHKRWRGIVTVDALGVIYVPLRPVLHASCAAIACRSLRGRVSWLQNAAAVGVAGPITAETSDANVTTGVSRDPREDVGIAPIHREAHIHWVRPGRALIGREGVKDVGVIRPDGVDEPKVIRGKSREKVVGALILSARRTTEDLGVGEGESRQTQLDVGRDADVDAKEGYRSEVLRYIVRGNEDMVKFDEARSNASIHLDMSGVVRTVRRRYIAHSGQRLRVERLAKAINVG